MTIDLDYLETVAKAATSGPWLERSEDVYSEVDAHVAFCLTVCSSADECCITKKQAQANAAFIAAANPAVVLEMIAEIRKLRDKVHQQNAVIRQQRVTLRNLREELDDVRSAVERNKELYAMMKDDELRKHVQSLCRR